MSRAKLHTQNNADTELAKTITVKVHRKIQARQGKEHGVWFGLGMMGLVGWSVAIPTLLGAGLGIYLDGYYPIHFSWTLALLTAGLVIGCCNAWHWVATEERAIHEKSHSLKMKSPETKNQNNHG